MLAALVALVAPPACLACSAPVPAGRRLCATCTAELPWLKRTAGSTWAAMSYEGPARALVHALKFRHRTAAANVMAAQIAANAPRGWLADATLTWAPAHRQGQRERGFDQAELIARALAQRTRLPSLAALSRESGPRQLGGSRRERGNVSIVPTRRVAGRLVVVDDVTTTGATLRACARALGDAGAADVKGVTYARALG